MWCSDRFTVVSEPFIDLYKNCIRSPDRRDAVKYRVNEICDELLKLSQSRPVFVNEMAYHAEPFVDDAFLSRINNSFLTRDPRLSIPSLYRMRKTYTDEQTGFEGQLKLFNRSCELKHGSPLVFDGERLRANPRAQILEFFEHIREGFSEAYLAWPKGSRPKWSDREAWHTQAIDSVGFEPPVSDVSSGNLPRKVEASIERYVPYYEQISRFAI